MTEDDITTVAKIMLTADGWCSVCASSLLDELRAAYPQHALVINAVHVQAPALQDTLARAIAAWDCGPAEKKPHVWYY